MTSSAGSPVLSCQPETDTRPPRASMLTMTRSRKAPRQSSSRSTSRSAAVPRMTRSTPASSAARTDASDRRPPPSWTGTASSLVIAATWSRFAGRPALGAVEVDDVEEPRPRVDPRPGGLQRRVAVDGAVVEVALDQAHRLAVEDVDGGIEDHAGVRAARAAKLASMRSPCTEDFSGWNCAPKTEPRATTLANGVPYSLTPSTSASSSGCGT